MRFVVLVGLALAACSGKPYPPYNRLETLRVLAVRAEPPSPAPGETTILTPLVYTPPGAATPTYQWSWCPFAGSPSDGYPCLVSEEELTAQLAEFGLTAPAYDLGTAETASFTHSLALILAPLCVGAPGAPLRIDCTGGFPIQIRLTVTSGDEVVEVTDSLRLRLDAETPANTNPVLGDLFADIDGTGIRLDGTPSIKRHEETRIIAQIDESEAESFVGVDEAGAPIDDQERLIVSWFVESGGTRTTRTSFIAGQVPIEVTRENFWEPEIEAEYAPDSAQIIVVIRDSRGGVGWRLGVAELQGDE